MKLKIIKMEDSTTDGQLYVTFWSKMSKKEFIEVMQKAEHNYVEVQLK